MVVLLQFHTQDQLTDSVAPVAIPCKMRHAMCSWNERLVAAPIVLPTSRIQQPSKIGRRPKTMHNGKIMKAPAILSAKPIIPVLHDHYSPKAITKLGYVVNLTISSTAYPS